MNECVLLFYSVMLMASGILCIFSIFSDGTFSFFEIILYIGELTLYLLLGLKLFGLISKFSEGLLYLVKNSNDIEKEVANDFNDTFKYIPTFE